MLQTKKGILNPDHDYSLQQLIGLPIIRWSCIAHPVNLAMCDFLENSRYAIFDPLQKVTHALPRDGKSEFASMPRINAARRLPCYEVYFQRAALNESSRCLIQLRRLDLAEIVNISPNLILRVEGNPNLYSEAFSTHADALHRLGQLRVTDYRSLAPECLTKRFTSTADFAHIVAMYAFSPQGHDHLRGFPKSSSDAMFRGGWAKQRIFSLCTIFRIARHHVVN
jgi:hypothetical protein